jgi:hypothetical protein
MIRLRKIMNDYDKVVGIAEVNFGIRKGVHSLGGRGQKNSVRSNRPCVFIGWNKKIKSESRMYQLEL